MLKKLILENWKSFRYAELLIDPLTVLIGANASGKSNALEALDFLRRTVTGQEIKAALVGDSTLPAIRGGVEWAALKPQAHLTLKILVQGEDENRDYLYSLTVQTVHRLQLLSESLVSISYQLIQEPSKISLFNTEKLSFDQPGITVNFYIKEGKQFDNFRRISSILSQLNTFYLPQQTILTRANIP